LAVIGRDIRSQATSDPAPARWITVGSKERKKWPTANKPKRGRGKIRGDEERDQLYTET